MKEKIGEVSLNYKFYKGTDTYSDGDIEDRLLEIVSQTENLEEQLLKEDNWALLYHLSPIRHNVLKWYEFEKNSSVLEIGAGCGAITGLLCEKAEQVVAIDLSKKRSTINATRNKKYNNLEIFVGNFEDIKLEQKFDYITLIGVLEYSIYYINSKDPFVDMLKKVRQMLKPGGKLLIAIENKNGLKYWAGAKEDHTGEYFDGINDYVGVDRVRTFSKKGLKEILEKAGFENNDFYYPVPDYKLPLEVYSEGYLPKPGSIKAQSPAYDRDRLKLFDEVLAYNSLCEDGLFEEFANSFIVVSE